MKLSSGIGPKSLGAGAKLRLFQESMLVALNSGVSYRDFSFSFYGTTSTQTHVYYSGLLVTAGRLHPPEP